MADITKIKHGSNVYNIKDAGAARQEQADWNTNNGVKNLANFSNPFSGTGSPDLYVNLPAGDYTVSWSKIESGDTTSEQSGFTIFYNDGVYISPILLFDRGVFGKYTDTANKAHGGIRNLKFYASSSYNASLGKSITVYDLMLRPAFIMNDTFEPYAMSNVELTAIISDLQARISALENQ